MPPFKDLAGKRFGRLIAIEPIHGDRKHPLKWKCKCDCGRIVEIGSQALREVVTRSCGCYSHDVKAMSKFKHGMSGTRIYHVWEGIIDRCNNENSPSYKNYGGRGIKVCDEWREPTEFINWGFLNGYSDNLTIDRIDVNGNYCPENCRWITNKEQQRNKRNNIYIEYNGERMVLQDWSEKIGIKPQIIKARLDRNWSIEEALTIIPSKYNNIKKIRKSTKALVSDIELQTDSTN